MAYVVEGVREFFRRFVAPLMVSSGAYARDLFTRHGKKEASARVARAAEKARRKTLWQRSHDD